jgi:hypothetical protein
VLPISSLTPLARASSNEPPPQPLFERLTHLCERLAAALRADAMDEENA